MKKIRITKNLLVRLDLVLGVMLVVSASCLILLLSHRAIFDPDIWLHLKTGELIIQNRAVPSGDIFSFTAAAKPWVDHSWLFQLLSYSVYSNWQADGLIVLECLTIIAAFFILLLMGRRLIGSYMEAGVFLVLAAYASITRFNIRPDIFSLLFFAAYLYLLRLDIDKKALWLLVPIQVLWVNFHGYFFLGPLLVFFFILAEFLRRRLKFLPWSWKEQFALSDASYKRLGQVFFLVVLACLLNPRAFQGAFYPLGIFNQLLSGKVQVFLKNIQELQPTLGIIGRLGRFYSAMVIICLALMAVNFRRLKVIEVILALFFFLFSLSLRNIAFFVFICYMLIVSYIAEALKKAAPRIQPDDPLKRKSYLLFRCLLALIFTVFLGIKIDKALDQIYYDFQAREFRSALTGVDYRNYPRAAVDFILQNNLSPNMLNDFNSGAYLIGRAYPKRRVFIDGRTELYGPEFFKQYIEILGGDIAGFKRVTDRYQIDAVLLSTALSDAPKLAGYLYKSPQWKLVFFDESAAVFLKDVPRNQGLIKRHGIDLNKYAAPKTDLKELRLKAVYPSPYIKRAFLFNLFEEDESVISECLEALRIMPNCSAAFRLLGKAYLRKGLYQEALQSLRGALVLSPGNPEALTDLGACYNGLGESESAIDILKRTLRANRRYAPAYYRLGCLYLDINNEKGAIRALGYAIRYKPEDPEYHLKLAGAFFELGKKSKDRALLIKADSGLKEALELNKRYQNDKLDKEIEDKLKAVKISLAIQ